MARDLAEQLEMIFHSFESRISVHALHGRTTGASLITCTMSAEAYKPEPPFHATVNKLKYYQGFAHFYMFIRTDHVSAGSQNCL